MAGVLERVGCRLSARVAGTAAHPFAQCGVLLLCAAWLWRGHAVDTLTLALSIVAITLTQMVLNMQKSREAEAHRRDVALHAKLDELIVSMNGARDELAGIEEREEDEIEAVRHHAASAAATGAAATGAAATETTATETTVVTLEPATSPERRARRGAPRKAAAGG